MQKIKIAVKNTIAYLLYYSGLLSLIKHYKLKNRVCVLAYHRVLPEEMLGKINSTSGIVTDSNLFRKHLSWLKQEFQIIGMEEMNGILANPEKQISNGCLVTFDDGWRDNYLYARSLLEQEGIPATIFLPYNYIDSGEVFWQEELLARLSLLNDSGEEPDKLFLQELTGYEGKTDKYQLRGYITGLKSKTYSEINAILDSLRSYQKDRPITLEHDSYLTWDQVSDMEASNISFGSHAMTHRILTKIDPEDARHEISASKAMLEKQIGKAVDTIAYPNGNSNRAVENMVAESDYKLGFTISPGYVSKDSNSMALPRFNIHSNNSRNKPILLCTILQIF